MVAARSVSTKYIFGVTFLCLGYETLEIEIIHQDSTLLYQLKVRNTLKAHKNMRNTAAKKSVIPM